LREWDQRTAANKTFKEFRKIIVDEFTKRTNVATSPPQNQSNLASPTKPQKKHASVKPMKPMQLHTPSQKVTFPGLTPKNISRFFPESDETQKGHMRQQRQGVRSTRVVDEDAMLENPIKPGENHKNVYLRVFDTTKKLMYADQTG
jgi:hypothetical protein